MPDEAPTQVDSTLERVSQMLRLTSYCGDLVSKLECML